MKRKNVFDDQRKLFFFFFFIFFSLFFFFSLCWEEGCKLVAPFYYTDNMKASIVCFVASVAIAAASGRAPVSASGPAPWPGAMTAPFFTVPAAGTVAMGTLFYSAALNASRLDHAAGSHECVRHYNTSTQPCTLLLVPGGGPAGPSATGQMYAVVGGAPGAPGTTCCVDAAVGSVPRDWGSGAAFVGPAEVLGRAALEWQKGGHSFWTDARTGLPARFGFPNGGVQDLWFLQSELVVAEVPKGIFAVPPSCTQPCAKN
jgi:hypothetical protein